MNLKKNAILSSAEKIDSENISQLEKYRTKNIPAAGKPAKDLGDTNQLRL